MNFPDAGLALRLADRKRMSFVLERKHERHMSSSGLRSWEKSNTDEYMLTHEVRVARDLSDTMSPP